MLCVDGGSSGGVGKLADLFGSKEGLMAANVENLCVLVSGAQRSEHNSTRTRAHMRCSRRPLRR